jgi:hypothetical protein
MLLAASALLVPDRVEAGDEGNPGVWRQERRSVFPQPRDPWQQWGRPQREPQYHIQPWPPVHHVPAHAVWVPAQWVWNGHQWVWVPGYWHW